MSLLEKIPIFNSFLKKIVIPQELQDTAADVIGVDKYHQVIIGNNSQERLYTQIF